MSANPGYGAIAQVGELLVDRLYEEISRSKDIRAREIALTSPDGAAGTHRVTVYLYEVTRSAHHLNADGRQGLADRRQEGDDEAGDEASGDPLVLDLHYLVTAHPAGGGGSDSGGEATARTAGQHELLGLAMQAIHENHILRGADLPGSFAGRELQIDVESRSTNELTNIWSTFQDEPYRPSVAYRVTPVVIESEGAAGGERVVEQRFEEYS
ncbi:DUF4255 domain-containing protein [Halosimplex amylolyticum]|uniref:DUF4255 domain-containing protein n=1 Tax=Halosimplex amylolyticum TaxID=3396616 RepID=UPI003F556733